MKNYNEYLETVRQEDFERIDRYVQHQMETEEKKSFEIELARNPVLNNEVQLHQKLIATLEIKMYLHEKQNETDLTRNPAPVKKIQSFRKVWLAAASVILLLTAATLWYILAPSRNERLYAAYFTADPGMPTNMGTQDEYEFDRGMVDYKTGEYQKAIIRWEPLYEKDSSDGELSYFLGVSWLNLGNTNKSIPYLEKVASDTLSPFLQSALWYQSLAYIKNNDTDKAVELLNLIPEYPGALELQKVLGKGK